MGFGLISLAVVDVGVVSLPSQTHQESTSQVLDQRLKINGERRAAVKILN